MPKRKILSVLSLNVILLFSALFSIASDSPKNYIKTEDGIIVYPKPAISGNTKMVKLEVVSDNIIRVIASPVEKLSDRKSLITVYGNPLTNGWNVTENETEVILKTKNISAIVNASTGAIRFFDASGNKLLAEKEMNGRNFEPAVFDGELSY